MSAPGTFLLAGVLFVPAVGAALLALLPDDRTSARLNAIASFLTFVAALLLLFERPAPGPFLIVDDLNVVFIVLSTLVGFTTSVFSSSYIAHELAVGHLTPVYLRFYHAMYQMLMFGMNLALLSNNVGLMWVAVELATLTTVLMVGIYRTPAALEAAWKYFLLGSVGIALALFGTILVYLAARSVVGEGLDAMAWDVLVQSAADFDPALLNLSFVFLLLGYGTKVGLVPLHAWLPDAHAEGPTPISAVLSGLLLNVALFAVLRFKSIMSANPAALAPGPLMVSLGLLSVVFASFMLYRRQDIKRMFAYSSIEHMGVITFAFGMGGTLANFAGLLHMTLHSLTKSAIFFCADGTLHDRIPDPHFDLRPRTGARHHFRPELARRVRRPAFAAKRPGVRRSGRQPRRDHGVVGAGRCASRGRARRRDLAPAGARLMVPVRGGTAQLT
jgi:hydrogenase-4 component F